MDSPFNFEEKDKIYFNKYNPSNPSYNMQQHNTSNTNIIPHKVNSSDKTNVFQRNGK